MPLTASNPRRSKITGRLSQPHKPALGTVLAQKLTPAQVQAFCTEKAQTYPRTAQLCYLRLSQALAQGVKWDILTRNVCDGVEVPRATAKRPELWTVEEAKRFLASAEDDALSLLWLLALTTGARKGELLGLR